MKKIKITVMKTACYADLIEKYENPIVHACDIKEGQIFDEMVGRSQKTFMRAHGTVCLLML